MMENGETRGETVSMRGRPRMQETADEIVASVLATAGPRVSTREYSTRRIAELTGLSQSLVSRSIRQIRDSETQGAGTKADTSSERAASTPGEAPPTSGSATGDPGTGDPGARDSGTGDLGAVDPIIGDPVTGDSVTGDSVTGDSVKLRLAAIQVSFPLIRITFEESPDHGPLRPTAFARRAAALMATLWVSGAAEWPASETAAEERRAGTVETPGENHSIPAVPARNLVAGWSPGGQPWEEFLHEVSTLLSHCARTEEAIPGDLLSQLASRAGRGLHGVSWRRTDGGSPGASGPPETHKISDSDQLSVAEYPTPGRSPSNRWLPRVGLSATEQIAVALRKEMTISGFRAGDRLPIRTMAAALGLSETTVRTAMRQLADDGLLSRAPAGFCVPSVTGADVIDLYAARLHVGMVILRACAAQPRHRLLSARLALGRLEAAAAQGTQADVGEADLRFQQELAEASGLAQSARSFHALTLRLRMFISVLQLDYSPAVGRLVSDGRRLLSAVLEAQAEEAVQIWRGKLDHAVRHMCALSPDTFDAGLWARLSR